LTVQQVLEDGVFFAGGLLAQNADKSLSLQAEKAK
jgi:hypothetical protein